MSDSAQTRSGHLPNANGGIARLAWARAREAGLDLHRILKKSGVTLREIEDPSLPLRVQKQIQILNLISDALPDDFLGFHLALGFDFRQIGLLHYAMASSATLGDALRRAARYSTITNEGVALKCADDDDEMTIAFDYVGVARHLDRHQIEFWVAAIVRCCRELSGRMLAPRGVRFVHHRSGSTVEFDTFFASGVVFGADEDAIAFPRAVADMPVISADPYLNDLLVRYCDEALARRSIGAGALRSAVENAIAPLLPHGNARVDEIARKLGVSRRTLARRLAAEGLTFNVVLDQLRRDLAQRHVRDPALSVSQVAWLVGYQEVSAFTHAFKRWTGTTPRMMRAQQDVAGVSGA